MKSRQAMSPDYVLTLPETVPEQIIVPAVMLVLLLLSAAALASGQEVFGVVGVFMLAIVSVTYGAVLRPEEMV